LAECCMGGPWATTTYGASANLSQHEPAVSNEGYLFGEDGARAIVSCDPANVAAIQQLAASHGIPAHYLGLVGPADGTLVIERDGSRWQWAARDLRQTYFDAIPRRMAAVVSAAGGE
ncbi:MAG TPA: hypothetical protein PLJ23_11450, partial [Gemmatimonadales bacterium]|nr:hypothetical protein [Gemmatimonadales bacterium]